MEVAAVVGVGVRYDYPLNLSTSAQSRPGGYLQNDNPSSLKTARVIVHVLVQ